MRRWRTVGLFALVAGLGLLGTRWFRINISPSTSLGLYRLTAVPVELHRGVLVIVPVPASVRPRWPRWIPFLKPVAGVPGDVVCVHAGHLSVNNVDYGPVSLETHGTPLPHLDAGCQTVPVGRVFLASQAAQSLDGRYFGMTPIHTITAQAIPVLVWRTL